MAVGTAIALAAIGMQVYGSIKSGQAAKSAGELQGQQLDFNARMAEVQRQDALARGEEDVSRFQMQARQLFGKQRVAFAGQGVDISEGTPVSVQADAAYLAAKDEQQIRLNAQREVFGFAVQAEDYRHGAQVARKSGKAAAGASYWQAGSSALTGVSALQQRYGWFEKGAA